MQPLSKQKISLTLLIVLLSATMLVAIDNGKNDIHKYLLQEHLNYWVTDETEREKEWQKAHQYFEQAKSSYITDPDTLAYGARLYEWATVLHSDESSKSGEYLKQVNDTHLASIQIRPLWPHGWKDLAISLVKADNYGPIFQESFRNAIQLGHQEDRIQVELSNIGLYQWSNLTVENRKHFIPFLRNSARKHGAELTRLKHNRKTRLILCNGVRDNPVITEFCAR